MYRVAVGACLGCSLIFSVPAYAQGAPMVPSWNGFYVGANAGAGWGESKFGSITNVPLFPSFGIPTSTGTTTVPESNGNVASTKGNDVNAIGGGQFGLNWQRGKFVFGAEADYDGSAIRSDAIGPATATGTTATLHNAAQIVRAHYFTKMDWLGSVRARIGFVQDWLMVYATGGFALGHA